MSGVQEIGSVHLTLLEDRDRLKWRINLVKGNRIVGCLKPMKEDAGTNHFGVPNKF